jgi:hypothetical protein
MRETYGADSAAVRASLPQAHNVKERPDFRRFQADFREPRL